MIFDVLLLVLGLAIGVIAGVLIYRFLVISKANSQVSEALRKKEDAEREAGNLISTAQGEANSIRREAEIEAKDQALKYKQDAEKELKDREAALRDSEKRLISREELLDNRTSTLDRKEHQLSSLQGQVEKRSRDVEEAAQSIERHLAEIAGMSPDEAKEEMLSNLRGEVTQESAMIIKEAELKTKSEADRIARGILSLAIQRIAADHTAEIATSTISIPSDDLKGRIIGREGRNIRSFEQLTGTSVIIDDSPECVTISCFDPVRREIGRVTMESLIADGRIHPARIEEMYNKATKSVQEHIQKVGEQAAYKAGVYNLHPELISTLGRLFYRTSYGQNVLDHSLEVSYLASIMASELGLDPLPAKRAGLLHDIGKALDHENEGGHASLGADLAKRFGESPDIVHAIAAHHEDIETNSVLDVLIQASDAVSASRPGARIETLDAYIKRLEKLEEIANSHEGVKQTYAIQAGREIRVMVEPELVDEDASVVMAHDIAGQIENEMQYPGQIKVTVIRETRAVDFAK